MNKDSFLGILGRVSQVRAGSVVGLVEAGAIGPSLSQWFPGRRRPCQNTLERWRPLPPERVLRTAGESQWLKTAAIYRNGENKWNKKGNRWEIILFENNRGVNCDLWLGESRQSPTSNSSPFSTLEDTIDCTFKYKRIDIKIGNNKKTIGKPAHLVWDLLDTLFEEFVSLVGFCLIRKWNWVSP